MTVSSLPPGFRPFTLAGVAPQAWRNGGGHTRELLMQPSAGEASWDWRVSVADICHEGAFSIFEGMDRTAALLRGPGLTLCGQAQQAHLVFDQIGAVRSFAGETALSALLPGGPARLFNVMVRRGSARAELAKFDQDCELDLNGVAASVLLVVRGRFSATLCYGAGRSATCQIGIEAGLCISNTDCQRVRVQALQPDPCLIHGILRRV
ncbi:HutD family protein (plasmid) [Cupriavidus metallidurans]|uniref:HutD/Ves family protein n=1 Tax=Cupriavidus metallidurans TaxID=119219 RepID=UPI003D70538B